MTYPSPQGIRLLNGKGEGVRPQLQPLLWYCIYMTMLVSQSFDVELEAEKL